MAELNGSWCLLSNENWEEFMIAIGVNAEHREKAKKMLEKTGEGGLVDKIEVDQAANTVKKSVYIDGKLYKESPAIPIGKEIESTSLDDRPIKLTVTIDAPNRVTRKETGSGYTATIVSEVSGNNLTVRMKTDGGVESVRKYKKV